jgi:hypothetical protein
VWPNLPSDNCPLFPHLPTDDGHFGYKQKNSKKKKHWCYYYHMVEQWVPLKRYTYYYIFSQAEVYK